MGKLNEHKSFLITEIKQTKTTLTPSVEMNGRTIKRNNILDSRRVSIVVNSDDFPNNPDENEIIYNNDQLWIYNKKNNIMDWRPLVNPGNEIVNVPAGNIVQDSDHNFVNSTQLTAIQEVVNGSIPAAKIVQDDYHKFLNKDQVDTVNNLMDGIDIDGGDIT